MTLNIDAKDYTAENLRRLRASSGSSRKDLIEYLSTYGVDMHETTLRRIESGVQQMKASEVLAFCKVFGVEVEDFMTKPVDPEEAYIADHLARAVRDRDTAESALRTFTHRIVEVRRMLQDESIPASAKSQAARELREFDQEYSDLVPILYTLLFGIQAGAAEFFVANPWADVFGDGEDTRGGEG